MTAKRGGGAAGSADKLEARIELMNKLEKWKVLQWFQGKHPFNGRPSNHCSSPHATSRHWLSSRLLPVVLTPLTVAHQPAVNFAQFRYCWTEACGCATRSMSKDKQDRGGKRKEGARKQRHMYFEGAMDRQIQKIKNAVKVLQN